MDPSQFLFNHSSDDTLDLLKQYLPQIEHELREQIEPVLLEQFAEKTRQSLEQIQNQAELEYQEALETLEAEFQHLKEQKQRQLSLQLSSLEQQYDEHEQRLLAAAQEHFLQQNLDSRIITHPKIQQIADEMENEIGQALLQFYDVAREKKAREIKIRLQSREQRERAQLDKAIHAEVYSRSGLEELRDQVKKFKISLASLKSKYNLKMNGISKQIQELNRRSKELAYPNSDNLVEQLQAEIQGFKAQKVIEEESLINEGQNFSSEDYSNCFNFNQERTFGAKNRQFPSYQQNQFIQQDISLDSSDSMDQSSNIQDQSDSQIPMPPSHKNMISHLLSGHHERSATDESNNIYLQVPKQPLLNFNISKMLREQWEEDDLDRYLSAQLQKQNKSNNTPSLTSNFSSLYQEHLDRLNRNPKSKMRKLSEKAKQQLMMNLSTQRQKRQQYAINA